MKKSSQRAEASGFRRSLRRIVPDSIRWELSDKEHVTITMDVPFDCTAEAVLPMVAKSEKEAVAEVLGSEENGRYLLEPGHYEVSYQLSGWKEKTAVCVE